MGQVILYQDTDWHGNHITISKDVPNLKDLHFNDEASSCTVTDGYWLGYSDVNYGGHCVLLPKGHWGKISTLGMGNDSLSSLRKLPDSGIVLFQNTGWGGNMLALDETVSNLKSMGFNDATSSVFVMSGKWDLFQDVEFGGSKWSFAPDVYPAFYYDARSAGIKNDSVSSVMQR